MLRKIRVILAIIFFVSVTVLFLDFTGWWHTWMGWMAKIQFLPALLALNVGVVALLVVLTLLFGRIYCSVICPLGVMQDIVSWVGSRRKKGKNRFSYSPAKSGIRYGVLALFLVAIAAGAGSLVALIAPYSAYGRIIQNLLAPFYGWGNNLLAYLAERAESYIFYETEVWMRSLPTFIIALVTFVLLFVLAWSNGRTWCNTVCPVGTVLGSLSKYALFRPVIDPEKCTSCSLCARKCKASCIDYKHHEIDCRVVWLAWIVSIPANTGPSLIPDDGNRQPCNHLKQRNRILPDAISSPGLLFFSVRLRPKRRKRMWTVDWLLFSTRKFRSAPHLLSLPEQVACVI